MLCASGAPALTLRPANPSARPAHDLPPLPILVPDPLPPFPLPTRVGLLPLLQNAHPTPRLYGPLGPGCVSASGVSSCTANCTLHRVSMSGHALPRHGRPSASTRLISSDSRMPRLPPRPRRHLGLFADLPRPVDGVHDHRAVASCSS
jgi:hypothetical protein